MLKYSFLFIYFKKNANLGLQTSVLDDNIKIKVKAF